MTAPDAADSIAPPASTKQIVKRPKNKVLVRGDHVELAEMLLRKLTTAKQRPKVALGAVHVFLPKTGIWAAVQSSQLSVRVQRFAGLAVEGRRNGLALRKSDVSGVIDLALSHIREDDYFDGAARGIAFADGFARVGDDGSIELIPHSPDNRARHAYPFAFEASSSPTRWLAFLRSLFGDGADADLKIGLVQEFFGAALLGIATRFQRALMLPASGDNGKSTLLDIVAAAMPPDSTCAITPQTWGHEYRRAMLAGKLLNVVNELPEQDIFAAESVKAIISGDQIEGRHVHERPFYFRPIAAHAFAANNLPGTSDQSDGFWRRFAVLTFERRIAADAKDTTIAETIVGGGLPGIVRWLIEGAAPLIRRDGYELPHSHNAALQKWRNNADQVSAFLAECTRPADTVREGTPTSKLYDAYQRWAKKTGHRGVLTMTKFGLRLEALGRGSKKTNKGNIVPVALHLGAWARS